MKRKTIIKIFAGLFLVGLISAGLVFKFVINKPHQDYEKSKPEFIVSAAELFDSFRSDREKAEAKYNGQVVLLFGTLDKIENDGSMVTGVFVFNQGMFGDEGIRCSMLPRHAVGLADIPEGSEIRLKGHLTGYNDTDVIMESCSIIR